MLPMTTALAVKRFLKTGLIPLAIAAFFVSGLTQTGFAAESRHTEHTTSAKESKKSTTRKEQPATEIKKSKEPAQEDKAQEAAKAEEKAAKSTDPADAQPESSEENETKKTEEIQPAPGPVEKPAETPGFWTNYGYAFSDPAIQTLALQIAGIALVLILCVIISRNFFKTRILLGQLLVDTRAIQDSQKAFVLLKSFEARIEKNPERVIVAPHWENYGNTPALEVWHNASWIYRDGDLPSNFNFADRNPEPEATSAIGPHTDLAAIPAEIDVKYIEPVAAGKGRLFIWGWIEYNDIFVANSRYRTEFCQEILISKTQNKEISIRFKEHKLNNRAIHKIDAL